MILKYGLSCALAGLLLMAGMAPAEARNGRTPQDANRIHFARNASTKTIAVFLSKKRPEHYYLLKVRQGQRLSLRVFPARERQGLVPLVLVTDPSGYSSGEKSDRFETSSTLAGDYLIRVATNLMASNSTSGVVRLEISVR
jgi:hypothetical protein